MTDEQTIAKKERMRKYITIGILAIIFLALSWYLIYTLIDSGFREGYRACMVKVYNETISRPLLR
jgi:uncharacterized membrane protein